MPAAVPITIPILPAAPAMSGNLTVDAGWTGALKVDLGMKSHFLIGRVAEAGGLFSVYIGVYCDEFLPNANTRVVLGVVTKQTAPSCAWKIHYRPLPVGAGGSIARDDFWRTLPTGAGTGWNAAGGFTTQPTAAGWPYTPNAMSWAKGGGNNLWTMEIKIQPLAAAPYNNMGVWFPAIGSSFKMYVNALSVNASNVATAQFPWPSTSPISTIIDTNTPDMATKWGQASF